MRPSTGTPTTTPGTAATITSPDTAARGITRGTAATDTAATGTGTDTAATGTARTPIVRATTAPGRELGATADAAARRLDAPPERNGTSAEERERARLRGQVICRLLSD